MVYLQRLLKYILCLSVFLVISLGYGNDGEGKLKVMAYNIHHCNPPSKPDFIDVAAVAKVILDESPDLVALQEVDVHTRRSGKDLNQAKALAALTGMHYYFKKAIDYEGGAYGIAVLSKFPIEDTLSFALPMATNLNGEPRAVAAVKVKLPNNQLLTFASTHLDLRVQHRSMQTQRITEALGNGNSLTIVAGDFNDVAGSEPIRIMDREFQRTCVDDHCPGTVPVTTPNRVIDYIFYRPSPAMRVIEHRVVAETYASDHRPVVAILQLEN